MQAAAGKPSSMQAAAGKPSSMQAAAGKPSSMQAAAGKPSSMQAAPRASAAQAAAGRPSAVRAAPRPSAVHAVPRASAIQAAVGRPSGVHPAAPDELTRLAHVDSLGLDSNSETGLAVADQETILAPDGDIDRELGQEIDRGLDELMRPADDLASRLRAPAQVPSAEPNAETLDEHEFDEATRRASVDRLAALRRRGPAPEERTRAVNIRSDRPDRSDPSISDIDWDLD
jgi:hypothetical protein